MGSVTGLSGGGAGAGAGAGSSYDPISGTFKPTAPGGTDTSMPTNAHPGKHGIVGDFGTNMFGEGAAGHFGTAGGFGGTGLPAPKIAELQQTVSPDQLQASQMGAGNSLQAQQKLLAALQGQGGLQAQNSALANYQDVAAGRGPNPAMAALNQATGQNVANQASMMAGQRGAGSNIGLMARQAAQQGANTQQQAVGQGATMQAQQQLNAMAGQAGLANQMAGQQIGQVNTNAQSNLANQAAQQAAMAGMNSSTIAAQGNLTGANTALQQSYIDSQKQGLTNFAKMGGGMMNAAGAGMAEGGEVQKMAGGGNIYGAQNPFGEAMVDQNGPQSSFGMFLNMKPQHADDADWKYNKKQKPAAGAAEPMQQTNDQSMAGPDSGESPGYNGDSMGDSGALMAALGGLASSGGKVNAKGPSQKAVKSGDSYDNDKVPAKLSEGEIVLPRSVTMSQDPANDAAKFVAQVLAKRKVKK